MLAFYAFTIDSWDWMKADKAVVVPEQPESFPPVIEYGIYIYMYMWNICGIVPPAFYTVQVLDRHYAISPWFGFPPLTLDKPELAHTQRSLLVSLFAQTCRPASSASPVGYLALSLSTPSPSSPGRTQQVRQRFQTPPIDPV